VRRRSVQNHHSAGVGSVVCKGRATENQTALRLSSVPESRDGRYNVGGDTHRAGQWHLSHRRRGVICARPHHLWWLHCRPIRDVCWKTQHSVDLGVHILQRQPVPVHTAAHASRQMTSRWWREESVLWLCVLVCLNGYSCLCPLTWSYGREDACTLQSSELLSSSVASLRPGRGMVAARGG
jgi:hypothetical protein